MQSEKYLPILQKLLFYEHLAEDEKSLVLSRCAVINYHAGQRLRGGNADCLGLAIVIQGVLRAHLISPDGREITLYRMKEGEVCLFSASCVLDSVSFETHVDAEQSSTLLLIPIDVYAYLLKRNIYVERDSYKMAAERFSDVISGIERLVFLNLEQRIAAFLLDEATSDSVLITHEQLAINIGSAREAVSRVLKSMEEQGLLALSRGKIRLLDKPALYLLIG